MAITGIMPRHDHETVTASDLECEMMGKQRWTLKYVDDAIAQTGKAVKVRETDEMGRVRCAWIPKAACEAVIYVNNQGRAAGAIRFPMRYLLPAMRKAR